MTISVTTSVAQKKVKKSKQAKNIVDYSKLEKFKLVNDKARILVIKDSGKLFLNVETLKRTPHVYDIAWRIPLEKKNYPENSVFLLSFDALATGSGLETGEAKIKWVLGQSKKYSHNLIKTISISSHHWETYYIPFKLTKNVSSEDFRLVMQVGFPPQSFIMKNLKFLHYPKGTHIEDLPRTKYKYQGMEPDAVWRKEAIKRINTIRKTDFDLSFNIDEKPLKNVKVHLKQIQHEFGFGAVIQAKEVVHNALSYKKLKQNFNLIVLMNDLKIRQWTNPAKQEITLKAIQQIKSDRIKLKAHVLLWPGFNYMPKKYHYLKNSPEKLVKLIDSVQYDILIKTKGAVKIWDVVNEAYTNNDFQKITGSEEIIYNSFQKVKLMQPNTKRFVNEFGIISNGGLDEKKQKWYFEYIKRIDQNTGGLVDGIGLQSHIGTDLTSPEHILQILDYYAQLDKEIAISEFTLDIDDDQLREQYTRDFMIAAFSHPNVTQFVFWGLLDNKNHKVDIFKQNGQPGSMGKAYLDLTQNVWHTEIDGTTDENGHITGKAFYGIYEYTLYVNGKKLTGTFELNKNDGGSIAIEL